MQNGIVFECLDLNPLSVYETKTKLSSWPYTAEFQGISWGNCLVTVPLKPVDFVAA